MGSAQACPVACNRLRVTTNNGSTCLRLIGANLNVLLCLQVHYCCTSLQGSLSAASQPWQKEALATSLPAAAQPPPGAMQLAALQKPCPHTSSVLLALLQRLQHHPAICSSCCSRHSGSQRSTAPQIQTTCSSSSSSSSSCHHGRPDHKHPAVQQQRLKGTQCCCAKSMGHQINQTLGQAVPPSGCSTLLKLYQDASVACCHFLVVPHSTVYSRGTLPCHSA